MGFQCRNRLKKVWVSIAPWPPETDAQLGQIGGKRTSEGGVDQPAKKPRKPKPYVPTFRSGPYALVLGLGTQDENASQGMTKAHLIEVAQPYCDSSFTAPPDPTKFYTAWNSMKTLIQKDLVYEHGRPLRRYLLSEEGWEVAKRLQRHYLALLKPPRLAPKLLQRLSRSGRGTRILMGLNFYRQVSM